MKYTVTQKGLAEHIVHLYILQDGYLNNQRSFLLDYLAKAESEFGNDIQLFNSKRLRVDTVNTILSKREYTLLPILDLTNYMKREYKDTKDFIEHLAELLFMTVYYSFTTSLFARRLSSDDFKQELVTKLSDLLARYKEKSSLDGYDIKTNMQKLIIDEKQAKLRQTKLENLAKRNKGGRKSAFTEIDENELIEMFVKHTDKEIAERLEIKESTVRGKRNKLVNEYIVDKDTKLKQLRDDIKANKGTDLEQVIKEEQKEVKATKDILYFDKRSRALVDDNEALNKLIKIGLSRRNVL